MRKNVFWPVAMIIMGLIFLASNLGLLPRDFWELWPLILIIVGLGGLLTSDRDGWLCDDKKTAQKTASSMQRGKSQTKKKK